MQSGGVRHQIVKTFLAMNYTAAKGRPFSIGLNSRDSIVVYVRHPLENANTETLMSALAYCTQLARKISTLTDTMSLFMKR